MAWDKLALQLYIDQRVKDANDEIRKWDHFGLWLLIIAFVVHGLSLTDLFSHVSGMINIPATLMSAVGAYAKFARPYELRKELSLLIFISNNIHVTEMADQLVTLAIGKGK